MREVSSELAAWVREGKAFALASVVKVGGSAPREPGAVLAVDADGVAVGSVSGGCVEGATYELCRQVLETGEPVLQEFGYSDDDAFAAGLTCGGRIELYVQRIDPIVGAALSTVDAGTPVALARDLPSGRALIVTPDGVRGTLGSPRKDRAVVAQARALLESGRTDRLRCIGGRDVDIFIEAYAPPPRLLVFGAIDFAAALVRVGKLLGYRVTVCDARPVFATRQRFPEADDVVADWPHRYLRTAEVDSRTAICVLTHDLKFDVPLLKQALRLPVGYVGAMGSRRTHEQRLEALREAGVSATELARLRSPIGLALGGRTPEETAISIAAELVAVKNGGSANPLSMLEGPIHDPDVLKRRRNARRPATPLAA
ncbi:MAG TPA: XshC-Cox1-family protein [Micromonosporaceae bacterium]|nr:XshC-Cox1-family protein [Micromonosporaceae bacterium]